MALFEFWRDIIPGSPDDTVNRYRLETDDDSIVFDTFTVMSGVLGPVHPPVGTVITSLCVGLDFTVWKGTGGPSSVAKEVTEDSPSCCELSGTSFNVSRTNNTNILTPNGTIKIIATDVDITDFEASIDAGATWHTDLTEIEFDSLPAGTYSVIVREIGTVCTLIYAVIISDVITYPPLIASESTQPPLYSPVFHPIVLGFELDNSTGTIKEDGGGTYIEVVSDDAKEYLATLPIIKILQSDDYAGTWQVVSVDDVDAPTKFYIEGLTYVADEVVKFVPYDRQVFQLFAEKTFNVYSKIADITVYPDADGEYLLRLEGFLQGVFEVKQPINVGDEITLLRKYYVVPKEFDMEDAPTIYNAVYSAIEDLTPYLDELVPLGPAPINFINEQTLKGLPVLFSYIDTDTGRVVNVTSSQQTDIIANGTEVYIPGLPGNTYEVSWINPLGAISLLGVTPALPAWITILPSASDTIKLAIDLGMTIDGGDYDGDDYDGDDYLTGGPNAIVGCYEFVFDDTSVELFTLRICVFPIQSSDGVCGDDLLNIAWVNLQGGWSSYSFDGKKTFGVDVGEVSTFKKGLELRRATVNNTYDTIEMSLANKSIKDLKFIASLRYSIQAFLYDPLTAQWSIPIILDKQSFPVYSLPFNQLDLEQKIRFRLAEEKVIQSQ